MALEESSDDLPEGITLPDLRGIRLIELLHSRDPALLAALDRLTDVVSDPSTITSGWQSAIVE